VENQLPITFLHAEISEFKTVDHPANGFAAERDTFDQGSGDSDTN
jgi:hypothetical protein